MRDAIMINLRLKTQTLAMAYEELASGRAEFRVAVGNFINAFFLYQIDNRQALLDDPIQVPENPTVEQLGWAAFCAGAAEYLAERYGLQCPAWALEPVYSMPEPWCVVAGAHATLSAPFQQNNPASFSSRGRWCSAHVFSESHT